MRWLGLTGVVTAAWISVGVAPASAAVIFDFGGQFINRIASGNQAAQVSADYGRDVPIDWSASFTFSDGPIATSVVPTDFSFTIGDTAYVNNSALSPFDNSGLATFTEPDGVVFNFRTLAEAFTSTAGLERISGSVAFRLPGSPSGVSSDLADYLSAAVGFTSLAIVDQNSQGAVSYVSYDPTLPLANSVPSIAIQGAFSPLVSAVPEPSTWAMLIVGFGAVGTVLRRRGSRHWSRGLSSPT